MAFLPYAQSLIRLNERAIAAVKGSHVRVGASSNVGIYLLQPHVKSFLNGRDASTFDLVIDRNPVIAEKLENGEVDIALMEWWDSRERFKSALWRSEPVVLIVPPEHYLARRNRVTKDELRNLELLGGEPGTGTGRLLSACFGGGANMPRVSLQLGSTEAVKQAVKAGLGVSLVLQSAVTEEVRSKTLCAIPLAEPALVKDLFVIWPDTGARRLPAPAFVHHLIGNEARA